MRFYSSNFELRAAFVEHLLRTGRPETFPDVRSYDVSPPADATEDEITAIADVSPNMELRDHEYIPCNLCNKPNKFASGGQLFLIRDSLYIIGPNCKADDKLRAKLDIKSAAALRTAEEHRAEEFIFRARTIEDQLASDLDRMQVVAECADQLRNHMKLHAPQAWADLSASEGALTVGGLWEEQRVVGKLKGAEFMAATGRPFIARIRLSREALQRLNFWSGMADDAYLDEIRSRMSPQDAAKQLRRILGEIRLIHSQLAAFLRFIDPENWAGLEAWQKERADGYARAGARQSKTRRKIWDDAAGSDVDFVEIKPAFDCGLPTAIASVPEAK
jgi:hypothetical protein